MRGVFPGYYAYSEDDFSHLWGEAVFVFDTNVLLSLHVYPDEIRDAYFSVFDRISDRCWIPFHVALEYHRNKFAKIRESSTAIETVSSMIKKFEADLEKKISEVKLDKRKTGISDTDDRFDAIKEANRKLIEVVEGAKSSHPSVSFYDPIGDRISSLFEGKVGSEPEDQKQINDILIDADLRYESKVPPGYADAKKGESKFVHAGIYYQSRYGDLILWKQLIEHCRKEKINKIIFITADQKEDWWLKIDGKTIGPRPELAHEIIKLGGVQMFWMYSVDNFLKYSQNYFNIENVTNNMIEEIKRTVVSEFVSDDSEKISRVMPDSYFERIFKRNNSLNEKINRSNFNNYMIKANIDICEKIILEEYVLLDVFFQKINGIPRFVADSHGFVFGLDIVIIDFSESVYHGLLAFFESSYYQEIVKANSSNDYDVYTLKIVLGSSYEYINLEGEINNDIKHLVNKFSSGGAIPEVDVGYIHFPTARFIDLV